MPVLQESSPKLRLSTERDCVSQGSLTSQNAHLTRCAGSSKVDAATCAKLALAALIQACGAMSAHLPAPEPVTAIAASPAHRSPVEPGPSPHPDVGEHVAPPDDGANLEQWPCQRLKEDVRAGAEPRYFADKHDMMSPSSNYTWVEFPTKEAMLAHPGPVYTSASVWEQPYGLLVLMTFSSPSGDWVQHVTYCFRKDGTLAQTEARLRTFYAHPNPVLEVRRRAYRRDGTTASDSVSVVDLETNKVVQHRNFMKHEEPNYRTRDELPFRDILEHSR